jgi:hypothetical protein
MIGGVFMKRILIIICLIFMFVSCSTEKLEGEYGPSKLFVNDEESGCVKGTVLLTHSGLSKLTIKSQDQCQGGRFS